MCLASTLGYKHRDIIWIHPIKVFSFQSHLSTVVKLTIQTELLLQAGASVEQEAKVRWGVGQDCIGDTLQCIVSNSKLE